MMKKLSIVPAMLLAAAVVLLALACAKPPTEEMNQAIDAVTRAENDADAVSYAGNTLLRAQDALTRMQEEAGSKRYDAARNLAAEAVAAAEKAISNGKSAAARAREDAESLLNGLKTTVTETQSALNNARQQNMNIDADALGGELLSAKDTIEDAQRSLSAGNYPDASSKGRTARSELEDIKARIAEAAQAVSRKK
jgi:lipopolysaccharide export LptBFGC system permease protein LptF